MVLPYSWIRNTTVQVIVTKIAKHVANLFLSSNCRVITTVQVVTKIATNVANMFLPSNRRVLICYMSRVSKKTKNQTEDATDLHIKMILRLRSLGHSSSTVAYSAQLALLVLYHWRQSWILLTYWQRSPWIGWELATAFYCSRFYEF